MCAVLAQRDHKRVVSIGSPHLVDATGTSQVYRDDATVHEASPKEVVGNDRVKCAKEIACPEMNPFGLAPSGSLRRIDVIAWQLGTFCLELCSMPSPVVQTNRHHRSSSPVRPSYRQTPSFQMLIS